MGESDKTSGRSGKPTTTKSAGDETGSNRKGRRNFKKPAFRQPKFEGKCDKLKGFIYNCSDSWQADIYMKTTKEIAEYVGRTYKFGSDYARLAIENLQAQAIPMLADLPDKATATQTCIWEKCMDEWVKRDEYLQENLKTAYSLIWRQRSKAIHARVEA